MNGDHVTNLVHFAFYRYVIAIAKSIAFTLSLDLFMGFTRNDDLPKLLVASQTGFEEEDVAAAGFARVQNTEDSVAPIAQLFD
jgi:hypothetical protein